MPCSFWEFVMTQKLPGRDAKNNVCHPYCLGSLTQEEKNEKESIIKELTRKLSGPLADEDGNVPTGEDRPVAIEVDGPSHFYANSKQYTAYTKLLGHYTCLVLFANQFNLIFLDLEFIWSPLFSSWDLCSKQKTQRLEQFSSPQKKQKRLLRLKHRLLTRMGYKVLHVPYFEWRQLRSARDREDYMREKLKEEPTEWLDPEDEKYYNQGPDEGETWPFLKQTKWNHLTFLVEFSFKSDTLWSMKLERQNAFIFRTTLWWMNVDVVGELVPTQRLSEAVANHYED